MLFEFRFYEDKIQSPERKKRKKDHEKRIINREELESILSEFDMIKLSQSYTIPPSNLNTSDVDCIVKGIHEPIYISGNYLKLERDLPQSPWFIRNERNDDQDLENIKNETSVEELIRKHLLPLVEPDSHKFDSAGREDRDVRMLGNGRPFVFCMMNPKKSLSITEQDLLNAQQEMNKDGRIRVHDLKLWHDNTRSKEMHQGATEKQKKYRCVIWSGTIVTKEVIQKLNQVSNLVIKQNTPIRVLHRRTATIRERIIHCMNVVERINDHYLLLDLTTSAGTYVKEFISSDFGRTQPSLSSLLAHFSGQIIPFDTQLLQLDVLDIVMD